MSDATVRPDVRAFIEHYQRGSDELELDAIGASFADVFLSLDPNGVAAVTREQLLAVVPHRRQLFARIGGVGADLVEIAETPLDELHTLVRTSWALRFDAAHPEPEPFELHSTFLLRRGEDGWRIVLYLNHHDVVARVAERAEARP